MAEVRLFHGTPSSRTSASARCRRRDSCRQPGARRPRAPRRAPVARWRRGGPFQARSADRVVERPQHVPAEDDVEGVRGAVGVMPSPSTRSTVSPAAALFDRTTPSVASGGRGPPDPLQPASTRPTAGAPFAAEVEGVARRQAERFLSSRSAQAPRQRGPSSRGRARRRASPQRPSSRSFAPPCTVHPRRPRRPAR